LIRKVHYFTDAIINQKRQAPIENQDVLGGFFFSQQDSLSRVNMSISSATPFEWKITGSLHKRDRKRLYLFKE